MNQREFLRTLGGISLAAVFGDAGWARYAALPPARLAQDDAFWAAIRARYLLTPDYINLENGYFLMQSQPVLEAFIGRVRDINLQSTRYMRTRMADDNVAVRARLAAMAGVPLEELIVTRNTTESLDTVIGGFRWQAGDEAVMAAQDYGAMLDMFALQARRHGVVNRIVSLPVDPRSDDEIVGLYEGAITPRTRLLMICHMVNITGQVLPVAQVADMAHRHGVQVMVDGAHTFGQLEFTIPELHGDYFASSLHKWLGNPLGAGILWVRRDHIAELWPTFADQSVPDDDIRKLNHTGTQPVHTVLAINDALDFHQAIGTARKEARLRWLQRYWTDRVRGRPGITLNTPSDPRRTGAIANVGVAGLEPAALASALFDRYRIWTVAIDGAGVHGVRVTPHLFTSTDELDALVRALRELAG
ncbi:MAG TPA: aminotransferase class V-fold PLP-dependent enzyme [Gemmatimonadales bacterium]|nr:aminotransferase class V-fold PLP-dependent enzyme [Gemmatimonadales bacterium]